LGLSILDTFNRLAAESLVEKIFEPILKPDAENTEGTVGGFFSKLFGLAPKDGQTLTANTTATEENTAAISGLTTAFGGQAAGTSPAGAFKRDPLGTIGKFAGFIGGLFKGGEEEGEAGGEEASGGILGAVAGIFGGLEGATQTVARQGTNVLDALNINTEWLAKLTEAVARLTERINGQGGSEAEGGLGKFIAALAGGEGDFAEGGSVSAKPGGRLVRVAEGGHDEVILTTDPRHSNRTMNLLRDFFARTNNVFGSFAQGGWVPAFAEGGVVSSEGVLSSLNASPRISRPPDSVMASAGAGGGSLNLKQVLVDKRSRFQEEMTSAEGRKVITDVIGEEATTILRRLGLK
jgi:hypothetical protein